MGQEYFWFWSYKVIFHTTSFYQKEDTDNDHPLDQESDKPEETPSTEEIKISSPLPHEVEKVAHSLLQTLIHLYIFLILLKHE